MAQMTTADMIKKYQHAQGDTGSVEVQIISLTERITGLTQHCKINKHDYSSRRGMLRLVNRRRKFLMYLEKNNRSVYTSIVQDLELRK